MARVLSEQSELRARVLREIPKLRTRLDIILDGVQTAP